MKSKKENQSNTHEEAFRVPSHAKKEKPPKKKVPHVSEEKANLEKVFRVPSHEKNKKGSPQKK